MDEEHPRGKPGARREAHGGGDGPAVVKNGVSEACGVEKSRGRDIKEVIGENCQRKILCASAVQSAH